MQTLNEKKRAHGLIGYENRVLIILFFAFGFVFFDRLAISFLFPFMQNEMNLTNSDLGVLSAVLALTWSISGPTLGIVAGRTRRKIPLFFYADPLVLHDFFWGRPHYNFCYITISTRFDGYCRRSRTADCAVRHGR